VGLRWHVGIPACLLAMTVTMASARALRFAKVGDRMAVTGLSRRHDAPSSGGGTTSGDQGLNSPGSGGTIMRRALSSLAAITLRFPGSVAPEARRVAVVGPFNGWNPTVHPLVRTATGDWTSPFICLPAASSTISTWTARSGSTHTTTDGFATLGGPSIPCGTSRHFRAVISMAQPRRLKGIRPSAPSLRVPAQQRPLRRAGGT
jgi:hypothetical protein